MWCAGGQGTEGPQYSAPLDVCPGQSAARCCAGHHWHLLTRSLHLSLSLVVCLLVQTAHLLSDTWVTLCEQSYLVLIFAKYCLNATLEMSAFLTLLCLALKDFMFFNFVANGHCLFEILTSCYYTNVVR